MATRSKQLSKAAKKRPRYSDGRFMAGNPIPVDVAVLNPDVVATAKDIGAAGLGLALGCLTGPLFNGLYEKYIAPMLAKEGEAPAPLLPYDLGTALISSGVPLAGGYLAKRYAGLTRIGSGMMYGSGALFVIWLLANIRKNLSGEEGASKYIKELDMGPLGYAEPALMLSSQEAGRAMMRGPRGNLYSITPGTESPLWELVFPDNSTLDAEYLGDVTTENGDAYAMREVSTGKIIMLPIEVNAQPGGEVYARPMAGIVSEQSRLSGIVPEQSRLSGIVSDGSRLAGIVPDTASPRSYQGRPDEGLQISGSPWDW